MANNLFIRRPKMAMIMPHMPENTKEVPTTFSTSAYFFAPKSLATHTAAPTESPIKVLTISPIRDAQAPTAPIATLLEK